MNATNPSGDGAVNGTTANKAIVRTLHERLWGEADLTAIDDLIDPLAVTHWGDEESSAVEAIRGDVERYLTGFTAVRTSIDDLVGEGDRVVLRWTTSGTHTGPYGRIAATGREITMRGVDVYRLTDGRIVEAWSLWDAFDVYQQLGLIGRDVGP